MAILRACRAEPQPIVLIRALTGWPWWWGRLEGRVYSLVARGYLAALPEISAPPLRYYSLRDGRSVAAFALTEAGQAAVDSARPIPSQEGRP